MCPHFSVSFISSLVLRVTFGGGISLKSSCLSAGSLAITRPWVDTRHDLFITANPGSRELRAALPSLSVPGLMLQQKGVGLFFWLICGETKAHPEPPSKCTSGSLSLRTTSGSERVSSRHIPCRLHSLPGGGPPKAREQDRPAGNKAVPYCGRWLSFPLAVFPGNSFRIESPALSSKSSWPRLRTPPPLATPSAGHAPSGPAPC